jgi:succinate dehydrogenase / fumarate reductase, cytochrome b subunit
MNSIATHPMHRAVRFYEAPIGKKATLAVTGAILFLYVLAHMLGNLQIFSSDHDQINRYAAFLHSPSSVALLWGARAVLSAAVILHILASLQLWKLNQDARPVAYQRKVDVPTAYAARTMVWSGPIILAFVIFHILHLTVGAVLPLQEAGPNAPDVRYNVIAGFQHPAVAIFYIVAMILLCMHLYHGLWSMFQSVGIGSQRHTPGLKRFAAIFAILIAIGNISIPIAAMTGWLTY